MQIIRLFFSPESPLAVGAGVEGNVKTLNTITIGNKQYLWIPRTTWKGALRTISLNLALSMNHPLTRYTKAEIMRCDELTKDTEILNALRQLIDMARKPTNINPCSTISDVWNYVAKALSTLLDPDNLNKVATAIDKGELGIYCDIAKQAVLSLSPHGRLFGTQLMAGKLVISDTIVETKSIHTRSRISIDRQSGKVKENVLFIEKTAITGQIPLVIRVIDTLTDDEKQLLNNIVNHIKQHGLQIGSSKSIGLGKLKLEEIEPPTIP